MAEQRASHNIDIKDDELFEKLESYSDASGRSVNEITEEALREYLAKKGSDDQLSDDDVFNPDPGA